MTCDVYHNENNAFAAQWLRNLIAAGHLPAGEVDERSIVDVSPDDLRGFRQAHFFAGIGGWPFALRLAGWPEDREVWTGSCPCQPFSAAGKGKAFDDERHLWPAFYRLIAERRPAIVFGEQVDAAVRWGWLDAVFDDLEAEGYACGAVVLPACSVGAPHRRQRIWWVADSVVGERQAGRGGRNGEAPAVTEVGVDADRRGARHMADAAIARRSAQPQRATGTDGRTAEELGRLCDAGVCLADAKGRGLGEFGDASLARGGGYPDGSEPAGVAQGDANESRPQGRRIDRDGPDERAVGAAGVARGVVLAASEQVGLPGRARIAGAAPWSDLEWLQCTDGKARPTQSGLFPLVDGLSFKLGSGQPFEGKSRVGMLRGYGNAIVPSVAAAFIEAAMECIP